MPRITAIESMPASAAYVIGALDAAGFEAWAVLPAAEYSRPWMVHVLDAGTILGADPPFAVIEEGTSDTILT